jgi:hypothetical protein
MARSLTPALSRRARGSFLKVVEGGKTTTASSQSLCKAVFLDLAE